jgi:hypothetical protein
MEQIFLRAILAALSMVWLLKSTERVEAALDAQMVTVGGEVRERYEFRDNADFNSQTNDTLSFVGSRIRLYLGYEVTPSIVFFFQMQDSRLFGSETSTASNEKNLDLHQGYLTVKNLAGPLTMTLGRQEMVFGDSRLVGNFGWSNIGRSFDALRFTYIPGSVRIDVWAAIIKQFGANMGADPAFSPSNRDTQQFYGLYTAVKAGAVSLEPYVMVLRDTGNAGEVDSTGILISPITAPATRGQNRVTLGLRVDGKTLEDSIDFTVEAAYQTGKMDARGTTIKSDISAYAMAVKADFLLPLVFKPYIGVEYDLASGDDNPTDEKFKTFENLFPTNHIHYGYMDYMGWRNMQGLRLSLGIKPTSTSGLSLDYYRFWLAEKADNWYRASGAVFKATNPTTNSETELGQEINLVARTMLKEKLRLEAGYGRFFPADYVKVNFPIATRDSDFVYLQATVNF